MSNAYAIVAYTPHSLCNSDVHVERRQLRNMEAARMKVAAEKTCSKKQLATAIQAVHGHHMSEYKWSTHAKHILLFTNVFTYRYIKAFKHTQQVINNISIEE